MAHILIAYSTVDGHTRKICERIQNALEGTGHTVTLSNIDHHEPLDCLGFDKIVIGASIRYGKHRPAVFDFIDRHLEALQQRPSAFFSVCVVARKPGKDTPEGNPYMRAFLKKTTWRPQEVAVFAGRINYALYRPLDRWMIRFIMWITHGPTDPNTDVEFTQWQSVSSFTQRVAAM